FEKFWRQVRLYLHANKEVIKDDEEKILFILSCMNEGLASQWAQNVFDVAMAQKPSSFGTFEAFEKDLKSSFEDPNKQRNAQIALSNTRQGLQETAEAFFQRFELNRWTAGYTTGYDQYLMELLERNLKTDIVCTIYSQDLPADYAGWKKKAIQLDQQGRRLRSMFPTTQSRGQYVPRPQNQNTTPAVPQKTGGAQTLGQPMDIDRRRKECSCYTCGVKGHIARFCRRGQ
ncbi:hypothetical protein BD410DRAFT_707555, partial [Rickenella mellea]